MQTYLMSACGSAGSLVDNEDLILNPHGVTCCSNCKSIIETRESWAKVFNYSFLPKCSVCLGNSKTDISKLCIEHYDEWFFEKSCGENW